MNKTASLLGSFVNYEENEILQIQHQYRTGNSNIYIVQFTVVDYGCRWHNPAPEPKVWMEAMTDKGEKYFWHSTTFGGWLLPFPFSFHSVYVFFLFILCFLSFSISFCFFCLFPFHSVFSVFFLFIMCFLSFLFFFVLILFFVALSVFLSLSACRSFSFLFLCVFPITLLSISLLLCFIHSFCLCLFLTFFLGLCVHFFSPSPSPTD